MERSSPAPGASIEVATVRDGAVDLHVEIFGTPPARGVVVFVPGDGAYTTYYRPFLEGLAETGLVVVGVDPIGHGRSPGARGVFTMEALVGNVRAVISRALSDFGDRIGLVGTGSSSDVVLMSALADDRVRAVFCHTLELRPLLSRSAWDGFMRSGLLGHLLRVLPDVSMDASRVLDPELLHRDQEVIAYRQKDPLIPRTISLRSLASLASYTPVRRVRDLTAPVLVAVGENDRVCPPEHCLLAYRCLPGPKEFYIMAGAGHQLVMEHTKETTALAAAWFEQNLR